jgi:hypothetical protein
MKIVRVTFQINEGAAKYYFDRTYDVAKTDDQNVDTVLQSCKDLLEKATVITAMREMGPSKDDIKPVMLNSALISEILFLGISVYEMTEKQDEQSK